MIRGDIAQVQLEEQVSFDILQPGPARTPDNPDRRILNASRSQAVLHRTDVSQNSVDIRFIRSQHDDHVFFFSAEQPFEGRSAHAFDIVEAVRSLRD